MEMKLNLPPALYNAVGAEVARIGLVEYWYKGEKRSDNTPLQLELKDGRMLFLDSDGDGESLRVRTGPWQNPFPDPLSRENAAFVETHGRGVLTDVSAQEPFAAMIRQPILEIEPVINSVGKLTGATAHFPKGLLMVSVEWDEVKLEIEHS